MDDLKKHEINFYSLNYFIGFTFLYPIILYNLGFILLSAIKGKPLFDGGLSCIWINNLWIN